MKSPISIKTGAIACAVAALTWGLAGCGSGSSDPDAGGDVPIAYTQRSTALGMNPTTSGGFQAGGALIVRDKSSPSAAEHNVTNGITQGAGDVSDPEVSYDGKKIVFAMNCPPVKNPLCTGHWNIWEYDMSAGGLANGTLRRLTSSSDDDMDPAYLPAGGGFVFTSNRQRASVDLPSGTHTYPALDEYERERVVNLHTMDRQQRRQHQTDLGESET